MKSNSAEQNRTLICTTRLSFSSCKISAIDYFTWTCYGMYMHHPYALCARDVFIHSAAHHAQRAADIIELYLKKDPSKIIIMVRCTCQPATGMHCCVRLFTFFTHSTYLLYSLILYFIVCDIFVTSSFVKYVREY